MVAQLPYIEFWAIFIFAYDHFMQNVAQIFFSPFLCLTFEK